MLSLASVLFLSTSLDYLFTIDNLISLITLTLTEVVLGIDNIVFIAILSAKVAPESQNKARNWGLVLAVLPRILLLLGITWLIGLKSELVSLDFWSNHIHITQKGAVLLLGGLFLIYSSTKEIHAKVEGLEEHHHAGGDDKATTKKYMSFGNAIFQILILNIIFSLDSVLTAVGLAKDVEIMIAAVLISVLLTLGFAKFIGDFVENNPTVKVLALSFLLLIGMLLIAESIEFNHKEIQVPKGYIYFAMAFSLSVELLNLRMKKKQDKH
jgi:predicted tellurium resistance membrane protein TerC